MVKEHLPTNAFHIPGFYYLQDKPGTIFYVGEYQKHFQKSWEHLEYQNMHCVRSVSIWNYSGLHFPHSNWIRRDTSYLSVFSPNAGKCRPEELRIWTLYTQLCSVEPRNNRIYEYQMTDTEAVVGRCSLKQVFLKILHYSQESTCVGVSLQ